MAQTQNKHWTKQTHPFFSAAVGVIEGTSIENVAQVAIVAPFILKVWAVALLITGLHWATESIDTYGEGSKRQNQRYSIAFVLNAAITIIWSFFMCIYILCDFK